MTESFNRKLGRLAQNVSGTGTITSNAATASAWETARTLTLGGDLSGNVSIDGSQNVTLTATVAGNTVALGTDTTGDYVATVTAGTGITTTGTGEGAAVTVAIDSTVTTLTGSQTLTNKTLTTPVISSISNTGTLTLPTSTDTLVGRATTDTLTNKTISGADNTLSNIGNSSLSNSTISGISLGSNLADLTVGTGVALNSGTTYNGGTAKTISIGQAVGTGDNVTFAGVTADNIRVGVTGANEIDTSSGNLTIDSTGGTTLMDDDVNVTGNLQIDGNLTVSGTTVTMNATNLNVEDNMIYLNSGSAVANPDLGFAGNYNDGTYRHAGLFRDASDGIFKFFHQYVPEPDASAYIDITHGTFALAPLQASAGTLTSLTVSENTGIGAANPGSARLYTQATAGGTSLVLTDATNSTFKVDHPSNAVTRFRNGSDTEWMRESSGNVAFDTNTLYVDATNNRVGVGTDEPQFLLHVHGATPVVTLKSTTTTGTTLGNKGLKLLFLSDSATPGNGGEIVFAGNADTGAERWAAISGHITTNSVNGNTGDLVFATKGSDAATTLNEVMRITGSGLVGIGSTNPVQKLDVYSTNGDVVRLAVTDGQGSTDFGIDFHIQNTGQTFARINANYQDSAASGSGKLEFNVRGGSSMQKAMVIDSNGRVGIGSTSPTTPLDVVGNINATNGVIASTFWTNTDIRKLNDGATLFFRNAAGTPEAVIDGTGQVGIGTTTPAVKLDVRGQTQIITNTEYQLDVQSVNSSAGASIRRYSASTYAYDVYQNPSQHWRAGLIGSTAYTIYDYTNLTDRLTILPTGKVGIGTTNPQRFVEIYGAALSADTPTLRISSADSSGTRKFGIEFYSRTGADVRGKILVDNNGRVYIDDNGNGGIVLQANGGGGNVGIGLTNPSFKLHVDSGNGAQTLLLEDDTRAQLQLKTTTAGQQYEYIQFIGATHNFEIGQRNDTGVFYLNPTINAGETGAAIVITEAGRVGVGTTDPSHKLHVSAADDNAYALRVQGFTNNEANVWTGIGIGGELANTKAAIIFQDIGVSYSRGKLHFAVNNSVDQSNATPSDARMTISNDGTVGIGTTIPGNTLHVVGNTLSGDTLSSSLTLRNNGNYSSGGGGATTFVMQFGGATIARIANTGTAQRDGIFSLYDEGAAKVVIAANNSRGGPTYFNGGGNVGIGTTDPGYLLDVNGGEVRFGTTTTGDVLFRIGSNTTHRYLQLLNSSEASGLKVGGLLVSDTFAYASPGRNDLIVKGAVSIGASSSSNKLTVGGDNGSQLKLQTSSDSTNYYLVISSAYSYSESFALYVRGGGNQQTIMQWGDANGLYLNARNSNKLLLNNGGGNVGIGTDSPGSYKLYVQGDIYASGTITEASSIMLKKNINPITDALSIIKNITGYTYDRKDGTATNQSGLIAEEVAQVLPGVVSLDQDGNPAGVQYTKIIAYLVESIKELKSELDALKGQ